MAVIEANYYKHKIPSILGLHVGHVGGKVQKNILSVLLWAPANVGEKHCLVCPERLVASQEYLGCVLQTLQNIDHRHRACCSFFIPSFVLEDFSLFYIEHLATFLTKDNR